MRARTLVIRRECSIEWTGEGRQGTLLHIGDTCRPGQIGRLGWSWRELCSTDNGMKLAHAWHGIPRTSPNLTRASTFVNKMEVPILLPDAVEPVASDDNVTPIAAADIDKTFKSQSIGLSLCPCGILGDTESLRHLLAHSAEFLSDFVLRTI